MSESTPVTLDYDKLMTELSKHSKHLHLIKTAIIMASPIGMLVAAQAYAIRKISKHLANAIQDSVNVTRSDGENLRSIIQAGYESNVDEMNIVMNKKTGVDIGADLAKVNVPIDAHITLGSKGEYTINIKYKSREEAVHKE